MRWSESAKSSGARSGEFCEDRGYPAKQLLWWSSHFKRNGFPKASRATVKLARVVRRAELDATGWEAASSFRGSGVVIEWHGALVRVERDAAQVTVAMVLEAVRAAATGAGR